MQCPECQKPNREGAEFCGFCGAALAADASPAARPRRRRWPWIVVPLVVLAIGAGGVFAGMTLFGDDDAAPPTTVDLGDDPSEAISSDAGGDAATTTDPNPDPPAPPSTPFPTEVGNLLVDPLIVDYDGLDEYVEMDPETGGDGWIPAEGATPEHGRSQITLEGGTIWRSPAMEPGRAVLFTFALEDDGFAGLFFEQGTAGFEDWRRWEVMVSGPEAWIEASTGAGGSERHAFDGAAAVPAGTEYSLLLGLDRDGAYVALLWPTAQPDERRTMILDLGTDWGSMPYWTPGIAVVDGTLALTGYYQFSMEMFADL